MKRYVIASYGKTVSEKLTQLVMEGRVTVNEFRYVDNLQQQLAAADAVAEALEAQKADPQRQLAEVTRERDTLKAMLDLQNLRAERANLGNGK